MSEPLALVTGGLSVDLEPTVFGDISAINVFSAAGDQVGTVDLQGRHADVEFTSDSGGIGRLSAYPIQQITVPVLSTARTGLSGSVAVHPTSQWRDLFGNTYQASVQGSGVVIGSGISILSVVPGGGWVPAGTQVQINGQGFTPSMKLQIGDVTWSDFQFVSSQKLSFTLSGPADLTGKLLVLTDASGAQTRYFSVLTPSSIRRPSRMPQTLQPIFPQTNYSGGVVTSALALQNASTAPIDVVFRRGLLPIGRTQPPDNTVKITIPPGGVYIADSDDMPVGNFDPVMTPSAPLRKVLLESYYGKIRVSAPGTISYPDVPITFDWRLGDPAPPPSTLFLQYAVPLAVRADTEDETGWLSATLADSRSELTISVEPTGLSLGRHQGIVTVMRSGDIAPLRRITVILNVSSYPAIASGQQYVGLDWASSGALSVTSGAGAVPIIARPLDDWLTVSPSVATTPATLMVSVTNPFLVAGQDRAKMGIIQIEGPGNTLQIPVFVSFYGSGAIIEETEVTLSAESGSNVPVYTDVGLAPTLTGVSFEPSTESGGPWLSASRGVYGNLSVRATASAESLSAGTYRGSVAVRAPDNSLVGTVSVNFVVWKRPTPPPTVSPGALAFTVPARVRSVSQIFSVSTGSLPLEFSVETQTDDGEPWLGAVGAYPDRIPWYTPTGIDVQTLTDFPGVYHGSLTITSPPGTSNAVTVPVTLTATPALPLTGAQPLVASIVNGASSLPGPLSPGEIVSVFGIFGANPTSGLNIGRNGRVNDSSYGIRVLFNGAAAPILYTSPTQINAVVPYEVAGRSSVNVEVDVSGFRSPAWTIPVLPSTPGTFTLAGSGQGTAAVLNQDGRPNSPSNPAAPGSIIQIFGTGAGQTTPPSATGEVTLTDTRSIALYVSATIGGREASVFSATGAPQAISGLFQINARIPSGLPPGAAPVVVAIGSASSQSAAIVFVQ